MMPCNIIAGIFATLGKNLLIIIIIIIIII